MKGIKHLLILIFGFSATTAWSQDRVLTDIREILPSEIKVEGFKLNSRQSVNVEAVGFRARGVSSFTRAWILNAATREVVWDMDEAGSYEMNGKLVEYKEALRLPRGSYEVYYSSNPSFVWHKKEHDNFFKRWFEDFFNDESDEEIYDEYRQEWREFRIVVRGNGERVGESSLNQLRGEFDAGTFISMVGLRNDEYLRQGFQLNRPMNIRIYAIGEADDDGTYDYGWIIDAKTRDKIWKFTYRNSDHAGGAKKNRMIRKSFSLPRGKYVALFVTDGSHSYHNWNSPPPYDPSYWGLSLKVSPEMRNDVKLFDYDGFEQENVIVSFSRMRNDEFRSERFTLKRDLDVRVYALGEGTRKQMYDYGWIVDANTHDKVWEMQYFNTEHAGGGDKNRLFDDVVRLSKGSYEVYYVTDDSHSYWDWNVSPPYDREGWGITLAAVDEDFERDDVTDFEPENRDNILAQLVRIRNYERQRARFRLERDTRVRIYAIGEGKSGRMYDYGWLENMERDRVVWEMTYRQTRHAGGAEKNRVFDDSIFLRKGEYTLFYESDDSHSYGNWNSPPPSDPNNWGVTVYRIDRE